MPRVARDEPPTTDLLARLKALGVSIAVDDYGAGPASLTRLTRLPIDVLKLDRSLVFGLPGDAAALRFAGAVTATAHRLGFKVIGEGVETEDQLRALRAAGCDVAQGYYFGAPMPASDIAARLR